jgi:hypothetical protein
MSSGAQTLCIVDVNLRTKDKPSHKELFGNVRSSRTWKYPLIKIITPVKSSGMVLNVVHIRSNNHYNFVFLLFQPKTF